MASELTEEASNTDIRIEQCRYEGQIYERTNIMNLPTDFLEIPQPSHTRGFLKLAEEARNGCVGYK